MKRDNSTSTSRQALIRRFSWVALPLLALILCVGSIPMSWQQQAGFGALMVTAAILVSRTHSGRIGTLILVMLSMCATARYGIWRIESLERYFTSPWQAVDRWNALFMLLLIAAELYSFLILYLGYMQTPCCQAVRLAVWQAEYLDAGRRQPRRVSVICRRGRGGVHCAAGTLSCQGRQHQLRAQAHLGRPGCHLRLRSRSYPIVSAGDGGLVFARQEAGDVTDAASLLFA